MIYKNKGWTGYLEGVLVLDGPGGYRPGAFYAALLKSFTIPRRELALEPGIRYDLARRDGRWLQRLTTNLTFYVLGDYLNVSANYELQIDVRELGHAGYCRLQAGF